MPAILPRQFTSFVGDSLPAWVRSTRPKVRDRSTLLTAVRDLLRMNTRFGDRVEKVYQRNQIEWLILTDRAADSLVVGLGQVLSAYAKAFPEEILTSGRVAFEEQLARIAGPPTRMLGFHVAMLAGYALTQSDSLLASGSVADIAGVQDGALRGLQDWVQLYDQAHTDAMARHQSQMTEENWILFRLKDKCGNSGADTWTLGETFIARVGADSTKTPPEDKMAHEYHLSAKKCPGDERVVYLDMLHYQEAAKEIYRRSKVGEPQIQEDGKQKPK
jgi:hypothetical protein